MITNVLPPFYGSQCILSSISSTFFQINILLLFRYFISTFCSAVTVLAAKVIMPIAVDIGHIKHFM